MRRYDYLCNDCDEIFELKHPIEGPGGPVLCPTCGSGRVHKILICTPAIYIEWKNVRAASDSGGMIPKFLASRSRKRLRETAADYEGVMSTPA